MLTLANWVVSEVHTAQAGQRTQGDDLVVVWNGRVVKRRLPRGNFV